MSAIPNSEENVMSFTIGKNRFTDSFAFLNESLDKLMQNLYHNDNDDKYLHCSRYEDILGRAFGLDV